MSSLALGTIKDAIVDFLGKADVLLRGSPARAIGYGAAVIIWLVANAFDVFPDMKFEDAVSAALVSISLLVTVIESIRYFVYAPANVEKLLDEYRRWS